MDRTKSFGAGRLVLVVDDHPDFALSLQMMLGTLGFRTVIASNGFEALGLLAKRDISAVLTDLWMPQMDGLELLRLMRQSDKPMPPVIAVTGDVHRAASTVGSAAASLGARSVLIKPFSLNQLEAAISFTLQDVGSLPNEA